MDIGKSKAGMLDLLLLLHCTTTTTIRLYQFKGCQRPLSPWLTCGIYFIIPTEKLAFFFCLFVCFYFKKNMSTYYRQIQCIVFYRHFQFFIVICKYIGITINVANASHCNRFACRTSFHLTTDQTSQKRGCEVGGAIVENTIRAKLRPREVYGIVDCASGEIYNKCDYQLLSSFRTPAFTVKEVPYCP